MIEAIAEHSVDLSLLPEKANILDLGCRNFLFTNHMRSLGHSVFSVDCDQLNEGKSYYQVAITDHDGRCGILHTSDKQATRIKEGDAIPCYTLESFTHACGVDKWHLIKMDLEGEEYKIIMSLNKAPARQLSIEFHLHTRIYTQEAMKEMENKLMHLGYEAVSHQLTQQHGAGYNYWDSLFIKP